VRLKICNNGGDREGELAWGGVEEGEETRKSNVANYSPRQEENFHKLQRDAKVERIKNLDGESFKG